jgi:hypothetical protein
VERVEGEVGAVEGVEGPQWRERIVRIGIGKGECEAAAGIRRGWRATKAMNG